MLGRAMEQPTKRKLAAILMADVELRGSIDRSEPFKWFAPYVDGPPTT